MGKELDDEFLVIWDGYQELRFFINGASRLAQDYWNNAAPETEFVYRLREMHKSHLRSFGLVF